MLELALATSILAWTNDTQQVPVAESAVYEATCNHQLYRVTDEKGALTIERGAQKRDFSQTAFAHSYREGSFLGRFTLACDRTNDHFTVSFFGVEALSAQGFRSVGGSLLLNSKLDVVQDRAVLAADYNLVDFNKRRLEVMPK